MKRHILLLIFLTSCLGALANITISGHVVSMLSQNPIADAEIRVHGSKVSVITNEDGYFSLKLETMPKALEVSALGHKNTTVECAKVADLSDFMVWLEPTSHILSAVTVYSAEDIVMTALDRVEGNFTLSNERLSCFYRETVKKQNHFTNISEAVMDLYKTGYDHDIARDKVQIVKGRSLVSQKQRDTLAIKVMGGPAEAVLIDLVKNRDVLFFEEDLPAYRFDMEESTVIDNRPQFVISFYPVEERDYPLYTGTIYVDVERLAFTRIETSLDMSNQGKATRFMLVKKPKGLRFKPKALNTTVSYHFDGECSRLSYVRNTYLFNCDWKRRLFATSYRVVSEMVVTDYEQSDIPRSRKNMFGRYDVLSSDVADFNDSDFWNDYNIIEPSESLEYAVKRLKKRAQ